jgi:hypothetical protein
MSEGRSQAVRWIALMISLIISSFSFLAYAYNSWMSATPFYDPDRYRIFSLLWLVIALVSLGAGGLLFFRLTHHRPKHGDKK